MIVWPYDCLTLWPSDLMIVRYYLVTWNLMIVWPYDRLTLWSSDLMFVWTYDLTLCLSGETGELMIWPYVCPGNLMIVHVDDRLVDDCLLTLVEQTCVHPQQYLFAWVHAILQDILCIDTIITRYFMTHDLCIIFTKIARNAWYPWLIHIIYTLNASNAWKWHKVCQYMLMERGR